MSEGRQDGANFTKSITIKTFICLTQNKSNQSIKTNKLFILAGLNERIKTLNLKDISLIELAGISLGIMLATIRGTNGN